MTKGRSDMPRPLAVALAKNSKRSEHMVTVGLPRFSNSTESWILHAVQVPQSPTAFIITSQVRASSSKIAVSAETAGPDF